MPPNLQRLLAFSIMSGALLVAGCTTTTAADRHDHAAHQAAAPGAQAKTAGAEMCPMHAQMHGGQQGHKHGEMHGKMHGQMHGNKSDAKSPADRRAMIERHMQALSPEQKQQRIKMMESHMSMMQQDIQMMRDHMNKTASAK